MYTHVEAEKTLYRYRQLIRTSLAIKPHGDGGQDVVATAVQHAVSTMSDPADLINLAVEPRMQQRFELPAFSMLERLVMLLCHGVHQDRYTRMTASLEPAERARLDALLHVRDRRADFNRIKETPRQATLKHFRQWVVFQKWRWTAMNVTLGLIFVASHRKEWPMTFIAVRCPHCQSDHIVKRGKTARGTQRYLGQNTLCLKGSFLLD